jgi:hypothetical protein
MPAVLRSVAAAVCGWLGDLLGSHAAAIEPPQPVASVRIQTRGYFGGDCRRDLLKAVWPVDVVHYAAPEECPVPELCSLWGRDALPFEYVLHGFEGQSLDRHTEDSADDLHLWLVYLVAISAFIGLKAVSRAARNDYLAFPYLAHLSTSATFGKFSPLELGELVEYTVH